MVSKSLVNIGLGYVFWQPQTIARNNADLLSNASLGINVDETLIQQRILRVNKFGNVVCKMIFVQACKF